MYLDELKKNLERIRELTDSDFVVPFRETIEGCQIKDASNGYIATMRYVHKEEDCSICIVDVEGGFISRCWV